MGYHLAGFDVVGVDIEPQPRYPFEFVQCDAIEYIRKHGAEFDAIHASPVCKGYTRASKVWKSRGYTYPDQIDELREVLKSTGKQYVIENVREAGLINPTVLNGGMFGLNVNRVRYFETSFSIPLVLMPTMKKPVKMGRKISEGDIITPVGNFSGADYARRQMGINWMTQRELSQAIPPTYTRFVGAYLLEALAISEPSPQPFAFS